MDKAKSEFFHLVSIQSNPPTFEVGLKPIPVQSWLLPDDQYKWIEAKNRLLNEELSAVFAQIESSAEAQKEVFEIVSGLGFLSPYSSEPDLVRASRLVSDDLIIMQKIDQEWQVSAATLCSPTFFDANHAIGKSLSLLHGPIPTGSFDLSGRIARVFDNMPIDIVMERHNWTVQWSNERYTPNGQTLRDAANAADTSLAKQMVFERVERQTIRKLPKSGAVLFTIRVRLENLWDIIQDAAAKEAFINAWENAPQEVKTYKKWAHLERHIKEVLG